MDLAESQTNEATLRSTLDETEEQVQLTFTLCWLKSLSLPAADPMKRSRNELKYLFQ